MPEILHQITINAPPEKITDALTTQDGLRSWWTADTVAEPKVGSVAEFGFDKRNVVFRMRVDEIDPGRRIVWSCFGDHEEWKGTKLVWTLTKENEAVRLNFVHQGWRSVDGVYPVCNTTWGHLMVLLKQYAEGRNPVPYFK